LTLLVLGYFSSVKNPISLLKTYQGVYRSEGWSGLVRTMGRPAAVVLFFFFLGKGLVWLAVLYGGVKWFS
jgi:hypothetical protein